MCALFSLKIFVHCGFGKNVVSEANSDHRYEESGKKTWTDDGRSSRSRTNYKNKLF